MTYNDKIYSIEEITEIMHNATAAGYNVEVIINGCVYEVAGKEENKHHD